MPLILSPARKKRRKGREALLLCPGERPFFAGAGMGETAEKEERFSG